MYVFRSEAFSSAREGLGLSVYADCQIGVGPRQHSDS
jgi:hypothetical protein